MFLLSDLDWQLQQDWSCLFPSCLAAAAAVVRSRVRCSCVEGGKVWWGWGPCCHLETCSWLEQHLDPAGPAWHHWSLQRSHVFTSYLFYTVQRKLSDEGNFNFLLTLRPEQLTQTHTSRGEDSVPAVGAGAAAVSHLQDIADDALFVHRGTWRHRGRGGRRRWWSSGRWLAPTQLLLLGTILQVLQQVF